MTKLLLAIMASTFAMTAMAQAPGMIPAAVPNPAAPRVSPTTVAPNPGVETPRVAGATSGSTTKATGKKAKAKAKKKQKKKSAPAPATTK